MRTIFLMILLFVLFLSCEDNSEVVTFNQETFIKVKFLGSSDDLPHIVIIDSVNHAWAKSFRFFQDTTSLYKFPISMNEDFSDILITFRDIADLSDFHTNIMEISYQRTLVKKNDNYVIVESLINNITTDFERLEIVCSDTTATSCLSNETTAKVFF